MVPGLPRGWPEAYQDWAGRFQGYVLAEKLEGGLYHLRRDEFPPELRAETDAEWLSVFVQDTLQHRLLRPHERCLLYKRPGCLWEVAARREW